MKRFYLLLLAVSLCVLPTVSAQLPGTVDKLTCVEIVPIPGLSSAQIFADWNYLDRVAIILENEESFPIVITGVEAFFGNIDDPMASNVRFYRIIDESALPNLYLAGLRVADWFPYASDPISGGSTLGYAALDLTTFPDPYTPLIFNPGEKYAVEFENLIETNLGFQSMKVAGEDTGECPPFFFTPGTNLVMDCNDGTPPFIWSFKEDVLGQTDPLTNFFIQVRYEESAEYRTPAMSTWGLLAVLMAISGLLVRRFRK